MIRLLEELLALGFELVSPEAFELKLVANSSVSVLEFDFASLMHFSTAVMAFC